jgi:hypothetical protein
MQSEKKSTRSNFVMKVVNEPKGESAESGGRREKKLKNSRHQEWRTPQKDFALSPKWLFR